MGITVEGQQIPRWLFHVELQRQLQAELYDVGAGQLRDVAVREIQSFRPRASTRWVTRS